MSITPVMRIEPLTGLIKTFALSLNLVPESFNPDNRATLGYVMGDEALTLSLIRSDEYVHE